jgi:hypothetical protein
MRILVAKLVDLNESYKVSDYAPEFFLFGSDGGGSAYGIEKKKVGFLKCHL